VKPCKVVHDRAGVWERAEKRNGETVFSYSRNFPKKGARTESFAYQRAYQAIVNELEATFINAFSAKIKK